MRIDRGWLEKKNVCEEAKEAISRKYPDGIDHKKLQVELDALGYRKWALLFRFWFRGVKE